MEITSPERGKAKECRRGRLTESKGGGCEGGGQINPSSMCRIYMQWQKGEGEERRKEEDVEEGRNKQQNKIPVDE